MKVQGKLPKGDADGLTSMEARALKNPKPIVAIVILEPVKIHDSLETNQKEIEYRIRRAEGLLPEDVDAGTRLLLRSYESRTGETTLPIELEQDLEAALKGASTYVPAEPQPEVDLPAPEGGYASLKVPELRARLKTRGLDHSQGTKTELIGRLEAADAGIGAAQPTGNVTNLFTPPSASEVDVPPVENVPDDEEAWNAAAPSVEDVPEGEFTADPEADDDGYASHPDDERDE